jgi:hypothetical protein
MLKRLIVVGFIAMFGVGGLATPSFATTGVSVDACASVLPNGCNNFTVQAASVSGDEIVAVDFGDCTGNGNVGPLDVQCIYAEVDYPAVP